MKKAFLSVGLFILISGVLFADDNDLILGKWIGRPVYRITARPNELTVNNFDEIGTMTFFFYKDGTGNAWAESSLSKETSEFTWEIKEGMIYITDSRGKYSSYLKFINSDTMVLIEKTDSKNGTLAVFYRNTEM